MGIGDVNRVRAALFVSFSAQSALFIKSFRIKFALTNIGIV